MYLTTVSAVQSVQKRTAPLLGIQVTLTWDAMPGALSYKVYAGDASGVYTSSIDVGNVTTYVFPHPGVIRYYAIKAVNADGESGFSAEIVY